MIADCHASNQIEAPYSSLRRNPDHILIHTLARQAQLSQHPAKSKREVPMAHQKAPPTSGSRKISFNVSDQYDIQDVVGEGAYGVVW